MKTSKRLFSQILAVLVAIPLLAVAVPTAKAVPVIRTFNLTGVEFADGTTASGSFSYDVNNHAYLGVGISLIGSGGNTLFSISDLSLSNPPSGGDPSLFFWRHILALGSPPTIDVLQLTFITPLDSASLQTGDAIPFGVGSFYGHNVKVGTLLTDVFFGSARFVSVVPEPSPLLAFGAVLLGLSVLRFRSKSRPPRG